MDWHQLWEIVSTPDNIPIVALLFLVPFFGWLAWQQARANDQLITQLEADPKLAKTAHRKAFPWKPGWAKEIQTWPYLMRVEFLAAIIVTVILIVWSITLNAPLEEPANPNLTMNPAKAPWYFLGLQEMLVYFDPWMAGVVFPTLIILGLMAIPYIDTNPLGAGYYTIKQRKYSIGAFCFGFFVLWITMIFIGTFIRGPSWMWFWPGMTWDPTRQIYETNRDLPDIFGITSMAGKMIFGAFAMALYFAAAGAFIHWLMTRTEFNRKIYKRMSVIQYLTVQFFLTTMLLLPIKFIIRRPPFRIKYIWITPWFNI
jgi:cytochrome b/b6/petD-like protein